MKLIFKIIDKIAPIIAARMAYRFMSNPKVRKLRDIEEVILQEAKQDRVQFRDFKIQRYSWGIEGRPVVLLVHGWEGQAGNFAALISLLTEKGYSPLTGFQLRYIYFLHSDARQRLTVPILPFSDIDKHGARMSRGHRPASIASDASPYQGEQGGAIPTAGLQSSQVTL